MWVCERCHARDYGGTGYAIHFSGSTGQCEVCHKVNECHDCHCYPVVKKPKEPK